MKYKMQERKLSIKEVERKLNLFLKAKTYTFMKIRFGGGFHIHNGYIKEIKDSYIMFYDKKLGNFPIEISEIIFIDVSREKNGSNQK